MSKTSDQAKQPKVLEAGNSATLKQ
jgi:hypothetical protein